MFIFTLIKVVSLRLPLMNSCTYSYGYLITVENRNLFRLGRFGISTQCSSQKLEHQCS